jgi:predicted NAD-dependent protein-ADP-ribosyltransferase YbiA (DUF1768 family)
MQNRNPQLETSGKIIGFYEREFYVLSNFSSFAVDWRGRRWSTSEHAYQAAHFIDTDKKLFEEIFKARSAHDAYKIAKANADKAPRNWDEIKTVVMEEIVRLKLEQNPYVRKKLLLPKMISCLSLIHMTMVMKLRSKISPTFWERSASSNMPKKNRRLTSPVFLFEFDLY